MNEYLKTCKYCKEVNEADEKLCKKCGRVLISITKSGTDGSSVSEVIKNPVIITSVVLFFSLFLPWFSAAFFKFSAFDVAKLYKMVSQFSGGSGSVYSLVNILIYVIPVGCITVVVMTFMEKDITAVGTVTGALPLVVFIILFILNTNIISAMGIGFHVSIISGITLGYLCRR